MIACRKVAQIFILLCNNSGRLSAIYRHRFVQIAEGFGLEFLSAMFKTKFLLSSSYIEQFHWISEMLSTRIGLQMWNFGSATHDKLSRVEVGRRRNIQFYHICHLSLSNCTFTFALVGSQAIQGGVIEFAVERRSWRLKSPHCCQFSFNLNLDFHARKAPSESWNFVCAKLKVFFSRVNLKVAPISLSIVRTFWKDWKSHANTLNTIRAGLQPIQHMFLGEKLIFSVIKSIFTIFHHNFSLN